MFGRKGWVNLIRNSKSDKNADAKSKNDRTPAPGGKRLRETQFILCSPREVRLRDRISNSQDCKAQKSHERRKDSDLNDRRKFLISCRPPALN